MVRKRHGKGGLACAMKGRLIGRTMGVEGGCASRRVGEMSK